MGSCESCSSCDKFEDYETAVTETFHKEVIIDIGNIEQKMNKAFNHVADKYETKIETLESPRHVYDKIYLEHLSVEDLNEKKRKMMIQLL